MANFKVYGTTIQNCYLQLQTDINAAFTAAGIDLQMSAIAPNDNNNGYTYNITREISGESRIMVRNSTAGNAPHLQIDVMGTLQTPTGTSYQAFSLLNNSEVALATTAHAVVLFMRTPSESAQTFPYALVFAKCSDGEPCMIYSTLAVLVNSGNTNASMCMNPIVYKLDGVTPVQTRVSTPSYSPTVFNANAITAYDGTLVENAYILSLCPNYAFTGTVGTVAGGGAVMCGALALITD